MTQSTIRLVTDMDWENERYVRMYVRDTPDLLAIGWEGRALLWEMMRKCDRAGVLPFDGDTGMLAELLRMPCDVVTRALDKLMKRKIVDRGDNALVIPNFMEAQEAKQSDRQRQKESRARRRLAAMSHAVTGGHDPSRDIDNRDRVSQIVTDCHESSQHVTDGHSSLAETAELAEPSPSPPATAHHGPAASKPAQQPPTPQPASESPAERYGRLYREWDTRGRAIGGESWQPTGEFNMLHTIREALHDPRCLGLPDERIIHGLAMRAAEAEQKQRDGDQDPLKWYRLIWDGKRLSEAVAIPSEAAARAAPGRGQQAPARTKKTATQIARERLQATGACL